MQNTKMALGVSIALLALSANAQYSTNFYAIPDKTPGITNNTQAWPYPESPGTYWWGGLRTALVMGFVCLLLGAGVRYWAKE